MYFLRLGFVTDEQGNPGKVYVPICNYNDEIGAVVKKYKERYCVSTAFQPTFNEYGMCFTFNNRKQGMDQFFDTHGPSDGVEKNDSQSNEANLQTKVSGIKETNNDAREIFKVMCSIGSYVYTH